jgi:hypothetical protein
LLQIRAEELKEGTETVYMNFSARKLDKKDFLGKSDPYLEVLKATSDGSWQVVHRTEASIYSQICPNSHLSYMAVLLLLFY